MEFNDIRTINLKPVVSDEFDTRRVGLTNSVTYFNVTGADLYITSRSGHVQKIEPSYLNNHSGKLIIRTNITYEKVGDVTPPMHTSEYDEDEIEIYNDSLAQGSEYSYLKPNTSYDNVLTLKELKEADGAIFIKNLDILVSLTKDPEKNLHPYSKMASFKRLHQRCKEVVKNKTYYSLKIVDNSGNLTTQYIRIGGSVQAVKPVKDLDELEGVHITEGSYVKGINEKAETRVSVSKLEEHRIEAKDYKEPLIFNTYEDALNFKGILELEKLRHSQAESEFRKREMENREREITLRHREKEKDAAFRKMENEFREKELEFKEAILRIEKAKKMEEEKLNSVKREHEMKMALERNKQTELELRIKDMQTRLSEKELKHKETLMNLKEEYEKKANVRKTTNDLLRSTPTVIAGITAVAGLIWGSKR